MIIYQTNIIGMGDNAEDFKVDNTFITFAKEMTDTLEKYCYYIQHSPLTNNIIVGDIAYIDDIPYKITAVGSAVNENIRIYGHACFKLNGRSTEELPGTINLESRVFPELKIGTEIKIVSKEEHITTTELLKSELLENASYTDFMDSNLEKLKITKLSVFLKELVFLTGKNINDIFRYGILSASYVYQILNGERMPSRDKLIAFCFYVQADLETVNRALKLAEKSELYVKNKRDSVIMHSIVHKTSINELNQILFKNDLTLLK